MAERAELGIQEARDNFRTVIDNALVHRTPTVVTRHGQPVAAVIPYPWYEELLAGRKDHDNPPSSSR
jgi:prevent-host-death family protein